MIISILALFLLSGCATIYNPATQRKETLIIDTEGEIALGRDLDRKIQNKLEILQDPQRQYRLNAIGTKVSISSDRRDLIYHFRIVDNDEFNAFAIPGGFIYVNSGLINNATDGELACVLGHEIGHIAARHSARKLPSVMTI